MHSISKRNFEIHIFALLTFRRKFQDVTAVPYCRAPINPYACRVVEEKGNDASSWGPHTRESFVVVASSSSS
jgi:hypothetical protein